VSLLKLCIYINHAATWQAPAVSHNTVCVVQSMIESKLVFKLLSAVAGFVSPSPW